MRKAVFVGSFDPITKGHEDVLLKAMPLFDEIVIGIGHNINKKSFFPLEQRLEWIEKVFSNCKNVKVKSFEGLAVEFCEEEDARFIIRGVRNIIDFEYEKEMAEANKNLLPGVETVFFYASPSLSYVSSTLVRDLISHGKNAGMLVPDAIKEYFINR